VTSLTNTVNINCSRFCISKSQGQWIKVKTDTVSAFEHGFNDCCPRPHHGIEHDLAWFGQSPDESEW